MLAWLRAVPFRREKLLKLDKRLLSLLGGDDQLSKERIDIGRPLERSAGSGVPGREASWTKMEVRRLSFSAVVRGFSCTVKSSLMSSSAYETRCRRFRGFSIIDGSRCSRP